MNLVNEPQDPDVETKRSYHYQQTWKSHMNETPLNKSQDSMDHVLFTYYRV